MAKYNPDWTSKTWKVNWTSTANPWSLVSTSPNESRLTFVGTGSGLASDTIVKSGVATPLCTGCHYNHLNAPGNKVRVQYGGIWYIITQDTTVTPTQLRCKRETSGSNSWTAVDG